MSCLIGKTLCFLKQIYLGSNPKTKQMFDKISIYKIFFCVSLGLGLSIALAIIDYKYFPVPSKELTYFEHRKTVRVLYFLYKSDPEKWLNPLSKEILRCFYAYLSMKHGYIDMFEMEYIIHLSDDIDYFFNDSAIDITFRGFVHNLGVSQEVYNHITKTKMWENYNLIFYPGE